MNEYLQNQLINFKKFLIILITGASGGGKTTLTKALEQRHSDFISIHYFDDIGIPSFEDMVKTYGSGEKWQAETTRIWIEKLSGLDQKVILLEGSFNPEFAISEVKRLKINHYLLICCHADKNVREKRLIEDRQQPDLATQDMENFAQVLRSKTLALEGTVLDSTHLSLSEMVEEIEALISEKIKSLS